MDVIEQALAWLAQDPDAETRAELDALVTDARAGSDAASAELHDRFDTRLEFGTAGLRGALGAGPNRMNRVLVSQAAAGFAAFLLSRDPHPSVVIGYDGRTNSRVFAVDTAELMAGAGVRAILLPRMLPTPVLAFAVRHLGVSAGVMVTASHNPAADNGYKVYLGGADNGSQIVPPADADIATRIHEVARTGDVTALTRSTDYEMAGEGVVREYISRTAALGGQSHAPVRFAYTAMHGVGWDTARRVFAVAGFDEPVPVLAQQEPDASFPTVVFPNPEEPGALDLAFATASSASAELVIANDPDADRLAVAIPTADGGWRRLSGNEVGSLLGWRAAERLVAAGRSGTLAASVVSSPALQAIAHDYGFDFVETLTGFKWISRAPGLAFGFEEALGYLVDPDKIRDKDGISAAVDFIALVGELKAQGRTVDDHLLALAERFGGHASAQISLRVSAPAQIARTMARLRDAPPTYIGRTPVARIDDFALGLDNFPASDILRIRMKDGSRVIVRPSGTEPKVKVYIDAASASGDGAARLRAAQAIVDELDEGIRAILG